MKIWPFVMMAVVLSFGCTVQSKKAIVCRHMAVECALVYIEDHSFEKVGIAFGPAIDSPIDWHAQAYVEKDGDLLWLQNNFTSCHIGRKERFRPLNFYPVEDFVRLIWKKGE